MTLVAVTALANASAWAVYAVGAALVIGGAAGVVLGRNPVHCALALVTTIFGIALLFINQGADFLAAVQIIVYAGAIVILFLFVIMLLGVDRKEAREPRKLRALTPVAVVVGVVALIELLVLARVHYWATGAKEVSGSLNGPGYQRAKTGSKHFHRLLAPLRNDVRASGNCRRGRGGAGPPGPERAADGTSTKGSDGAPGPRSEARRGPGRTLRPSAGFAVIGLTVTGVTTRFGPVSGHPVNGHPVNGHPDSRRAVVGGTGPDHPC